MADLIDQADQHIERTLAGARSQTQAAVAAMPKGEPGDCEMCGEWSGRLVGGACAPCRDRYKLP